ncbi:TonB-dependent receptor [Myroides sp. NP-2]|uniref:TonB-dependent receptor n=1 Tax=Myroides sp. NP-2 TaxID=2759945 RepID=UPI0015FCC8CD|nr:TonB-dependent receptor [Myroides sp. NP-2]
MKKNVIFCFLVFCYNQILIGQEINVKGKVRNEYGNPIIFATAVLFEHDSIPVAAAYTDSLGDFILNHKVGEYRLTVSWLNSDVITKKIIVTHDLDLGEFILNENINLDEISITSRKKMFERKTDRIIFNVSQSTSATGFSALETLALTPLVSVNGQGEIAIVGKNRVGILIDDKIVYLSGSELTSYLSNIRSENIARIEVLTSPPSKFDAQGNSGLINIVLNKNENLGWNGSLTSTVKQATYTSLSNNISLNYSSSKLSSSVVLRHYYTSLKALENYEIWQKKSLVSKENRHDFYKGMGVETRFNYAWSKNTKLGLIYNYGTADDDKDVHNSASFYDQNTLYKDLSTAATHNIKTPVHTLNLYAQSKLSNRGDQVDIGLNYFDTSANSIVDFTTIDVLNPLLADRVKTSSTVGYGILSTTADFVLNSTWSNLSFGLKYVTMRNNSDVGYFNWTDRGYWIDPTKSALFNYKENIYAGYFDFSKIFFKTWQLKLGLRYEYTNTQGISKTVDESKKTKYDNFFPSVYVTHTLNDFHVFYMSYNKRINRPSFREVDPFRWYSNPYSYSEGNPLLSPSYNYNFELGYLFHNYLSIDLYYQELHNEFGQISNFENDVEVSSYYNYYNQNNLGVNVMYTRSLLSFLENSISFNMAYVKAQPKMEDIIGESGLFTSYYINNTLTLNPEHSFLLVNYWQRLPSKKGNSSLRNMASFDIGFKFLFFDQKLSFNIVVNDLFQQLRAKGEKKFDTNHQQFNNYYDARNLSFSATYNFGKSKHGEKNKTIDFEETSRAN